MVALGGWALFHERGIPIAKAAVRWGGSALPPVTASAASLFMKGTRHEQGRDFMSRKNPLFNRKMQGVAAQVRAERD